MSKILVIYFTKIGTVCGFFPYTFDGKLYKPTKSTTLRVYSVFCSLLAVSFPIASYILFIHNRGDIDTSEFTLMHLVNSFELLGQNISIFLIVWSLVYKHQATVFEVVNCASDLSGVLVGKFSKQFLLMNYLLILSMEWLSIIWYIFFEALNPLNDFTLRLSMNVSVIREYFIMFTANLFFEAFCGAGLFYKILNKELKLLIKPLKKRQHLTHSQMLVISDMMDQKMVLHAKIGKFVSDVNKIFSLICASILLNAFITITGELYTFYSSSRMPGDKNDSFGLFLALYQIVLVFSFVYAANQVSEEFEATGDVLKVFLDSSADDRLKNSV